VGKFIPYNQAASPSHEAGTPVVITLSAASDLLVEGTNVLAIQTHNVTLGSSDMSMIADLKVTGLPEVQLVNHSNNWKYIIGNAEPSPLPEETKIIDDDFVDWLELYNNGSTSVSLKGWALTDDNFDIEKWIFPDVTIGGGEYLLVFCNGENITSSPNSYLHTNFKLAKEGEYLALLDNGTPRQFISEFAPNYPRQSFFHSYGWNQESNSYISFSNSTPGKQNSGETFSGIVATPIIDKDPGFYSSNVIVSITCATTGAEIRYTTSGNEPTESSALYSPSLTFNFNTALRVRAFKAGWIPSKTVTRTYLLNQPNAIKNAPIVSIIADTGKSLFKPNGITSIVGGIWNSGRWSAQTPDNFNIPMQRGRPYERPASFEILYYGTDVWAQTDCGIRIAGSDWTRPQYYLQDMSGKWDQHPHVNKPQINLYFRTDYGNGVFDFPLMPDSEVTEFDSLRLRGGKNDWNNPFMIDELVRRLYINMGQVCSRGFFAWLFVNGEHKAYFNLVE
ncbi:MAG: chitobiase/beta-hexosaminidase C-terminal domain-containing protein, partial [Victivallaceae bacterium]|nr:chitobiase/beta-hexosaminidase C-terminal domain-containing protein [Victivallaceae bacterium]